MGPSAVSLVPFHSIAGEPPGGPSHDPVPENLGHDGSGGNREAPPVAADDGFLGPGKTPDGEAVHQNHIGGDGKRGHRPAHGFLGSPENVQRVDFDVAGQAEADGGFFSNRAVQEFALPGGEAFGIVEPGDPFRPGPVEPGGRKDNSGGDHGAAEGSAAGFIHAGDQLSPRLEMPALNLEIGQGAVYRFSRSLAALPFRPRR